MDSPHKCPCLQIARRKRLSVTQRKSSSPFANHGRNLPRVTGSMGPPPPRSVPSRRNNVQVGLDSRRVLQMNDIQQFNEEVATIGNGVGTGSAQNVREYHDERPVHVNPTHDIYRERMPAIFYVNTLYPHFYADSMAAHHAQADRNMRKVLQLAAAASAPFNQGCHYPQPYGPGCRLPTIVPAVEPEAYIQQHYNGDQNIGTCWFPPGIPVECAQRSSSFMVETPGNETPAITRPRSDLKELALLPGCEVSRTNAESDQEQEQEQSSARSGVARPKAQRPAARAGRGGSGYQSAQNLSLALFQPQQAVAQVPLVIPDPLKLRTRKEKGIVVDLGLTISPNEASYLASASSTHHIPTRVAIPAPTLTAPNGRGPSPLKTNDQVTGISRNTRMAANLSAVNGDQQQRTPKNSQFIIPIMDILREVCHLIVAQQARKRPGQPPFPKTEVRLSVEGVVFERAADPRLGSTSAPVPGKAKSAKLRAGPLRLETASVIELETEKQKLLKMLEDLTKKYKLHTERLERLTKQFNEKTAEGMAEQYITIVQLTLTRNFGFVKGAIARRLRAVRGALGEDSKVLFRAPQPSAQVPQASTVWRPQRGLPEIAVRLLRGWLFEHFLHPYPNDKDKTELAGQTGLSRAQVSNWFINARVRLWKPMVEEMYKDECMREGVGEHAREVRAEVEREASAEPIGKLLEMNHNVQASIEAENIDRNLMDDQSGQAAMRQVQRPEVRVGVNDLGLIHVYNSGEFAPHQPDVDIEVFLTMPEEFAHVDKRLRPAMPLKICKLEPKDT